MINSCVVTKQGLLIGRSTHRSLSRSCLTPPSSACTFLSRLDTSLAMASSLSDNWGILAWKYVIKGVIEHYMIYLKFAEDSLHSRPELLASIPDVFVSLTQGLSLVPCLGPQPLTYSKFPLSALYCHDRHVSLTSSLCSSFSCSSLL